MLKAKVGEPARHGGSGKKRARTGPSASAQLRQPLGNQAALRNLRPEFSLPGFDHLLALQNFAGNRAAIQHLQTKLSVNVPGDRLEHEADQVADRIVRMEALPPPPPDPVSQARTAPPGTRVQRKCSQCGTEQSEEKKQVQRGATAAGPALAPASVHELLRSSGQPLDGASRSFMEPRFGHDFSEVRIHTGATADRAARDVSASAFTVGSNIAFAQGRYAPQSGDGRRLLAHELAHTIQQGQEGRRSTLQRAPGPGGGQPSEPVLVYFDDATRKDLIQFWQNKINAATTAKDKNRFHDYKNRLEKNLRPTPRQSEMEMEYIHSTIGVKTEPSYHLGKTVPRGTKDSTRPDLETNILGEIKNYKISNASNLARELNRQITARREHGPVNIKSQMVILDFRGQNVSEGEVKILVNRLSSQTGLPVENFQVIMPQTAPVKPELSAAGAAPPAPVVPKPGTAQENVVAAPGQVKPAPPKAAPPVDLEKPPAPPVKSAEMGPESPGQAAKVPPAAPASTPKPIKLSPQGVAEHEETIPKGNLRLQVKQALGISAAHFIANIGFQWLQGKTDAYLLQSDLERKQPEIEELLAPLMPKAKDLWAHTLADHVYANITIKYNVPTTYINEVDSLGGPSQYTHYQFYSLQISSVQVSDVDIEESESLPSTQTYTELGHQMAIGGDEDNWEQVTFSVPLDLGPKPQPPGGGPQAGTGAYAASIKKPLQEIDKRTHWASEKQRREFIKDYLQFARSKPELRDLYEAGKVLDQP
jgi:Domain of unknown function (DUF4157)